MRMLLLLLPTRLSLVVHLVFLSVAMVIKKRVTCNKHACIERSQYSANAQPCCQFLLVATHCIAAQKAFCPEALFKSNAFCTYILISFVKEISNTPDPFFIFDFWWSIVKYHLSQCDKFSTSPKLLWFFLPLQCFYSVIFEIQVNWIFLNTGGWKHIFHGSFMCFQ